MRSEGESGTRNAAPPEPLPSHLAWLLLKRTTQDKGLGSPLPTLCPSLLAL